MRAWLILLAAALALLVRLLVRMRAGQRWPGPIHLPFTRIFGVALCVAVLAVYWTVLRPLIDINMPSQALGMMWGVNLLGLTALLNAPLIDVR